MNGRPRAVRQRTLSVAIAVLGALAVIVAVSGTPDVRGIFADEAHGHVKFSNGKWAFRGKTIKGTDRHRKVDPVNVIFMGHPNQRSYQTVNVQFHILAHLSWGEPRCASSQRMVWTKRNSRITKSDEEDLQVASSNCGLTGRWHARLWDDVDHKEHTTSHIGVKRWMVGGVHSEGSPPPRGQQGLRRCAAQDGERDGVDLLERTRPPGGLEALYLVFVEAP